MTVHTHVKRAGTSAACLAAACTLIAPFEGFASSTYRDIVGVPTVCYGETDPKMVELGRHHKFSKAECMAMLQASLKSYDDGFMNCVMRPSIPDSVHIAGISLTYNVGIGAVCRSTFVRKINEGRFADACDAMVAFDRAGGRVVGGLVRRRASERTECLKDTVNHA